MQNKLVARRRQKWCEDHPEGSYRLPSRWIEERSMLVDSAGKPIEQTMVNFGRQVSLQQTQSLSTAVKKATLGSLSALKTKSPFQKNTQ